MGRIAEAIETIPGVSSVASSTPDPLLTRYPLYFPMSVPGVEGRESPSIAAYLVTPSFFRTFGAELLAGRVLADTDATGRDASVVVVSQRFAERFGLTNANAPGRTIDTGFATYEIVGVVADLRVTDTVEPRVYFPATVGSGLYVRSARAPEDLMNAIQDAVARVDPRRGIAGFRTMEERFLDSIAIERFAAGAASAFAVLATALAALGIYGILAYSVARRSREIGMRFALGATTARVHGMVLRQVMRMAVIGVVLGGLAAWALGLAAQSVLLGIEASDPFALVAAAALLTAVMLGAAYIPARRASRVDPMSVLRYE